MAEIGCPFFQNYLTYETKQFERGKRQVCEDEELRRFIPLPLPPPPLLLPLPLLLPPPPLLLLPLQLPLEAVPIGHQRPAPSPPAPLHQEFRVLPLSYQVAHRTISEVGLSIKRIVNQIKIEIPVLPKDTTKTIYYSYTIFYIEEVETAKSCYQITALYQTKRF